MTERIETLAEARDRTAKNLAFDGVYRAEVWLGLDSWQAVAYVPDGRFGTRLKAKDADGREIFPTEAEAAAVAAEANKTPPPRRLNGRLF